MQICKQAVARKLDLVLVTDIQVAEVTYYFPLLFFTIVFTEYST